VKWIELLIYVQLFRDVACQKLSKSAIASRSYCYLKTKVAQVFKDMVYMPYNRTTLEEHISSQMPKDSEKNDVIFPLCSLLSGKLLLSDNIW